MPGEQLQAGMLPALLPSGGAKSSGPGWGWKHGERAVLLHWCGKTSSLLLVTEHRCPLFLGEPCSVWWQGRVGVLLLALVAVLEPQSSFSGLEPQGHAKQGRCCWGAAGTGTGVLQDTACLL